MSNYIELYKRHRPRIFDDVVGQESVVKTLRSAVISKKIPTGYLFSGGAGTGKTTLALIFAKALNCPNVDAKGNPCNTCPLCKSIDNDSQMGVQYLSMANNGSAEEVRKIMEDSMLASPLNKKVFILDEVHNASSAAQDAMLIGLESENQKSVFICCTTDVDKVKPAIQSRLQQRTFRNLTVEEVTNHLYRVCKKEPDILEKIQQKEIKKDDLIQCAMLSNGSLRNALSNLESLAQSGSLPTEFSYKLMDSIFGSNVGLVFKTVDEIVLSGGNLHKVAEQIYKIITDILIQSSGESVNNLVISKYKDVDTKECISLLGELSKGFQIISNKMIDYKVLYSGTFLNLYLIHKKYQGEKNV